MINKPYDFDIEPHHGGFAIIRRLKSGRGKPLIVFYAPTRKNAADFLEVYLSIKDKELRVKLRKACGAAR